MSEHQAFSLLHPDVQRWVWQMKWDTLRDIQEKAIEPILQADRDVVISAATAAGKTEAAFLPACTLVKNRSQSGIGILYISPLKALINDQNRRLQGLCELLDLPLTPWHGDVGQTQKRRLTEKPHGIILITPESLESLMMNHKSWCINAFFGLCTIIIDEFHAFIGTERGCQLLSLLHRLEFLVKRTIPRVALSATLGEIQIIGKALRPNQKSDMEFPCDLIESTEARSDLKLKLFGYVNDPPPQKSESVTQNAKRRVVNDIFKTLRGGSHLVFANSRARTEELTVGLADMCLKESVPNEFFAHHGSLSNEIREELESRLQKESLPTTAVCTMTLELGIDIGTVDSIAQVTAPHSVASLRQRVGRSGRRGQPAALRMYIEEAFLTADSPLPDRLRWETFQCIAMVNLLLKKWYEPPETGHYHFSTLVQQTLSVIAQYGSATANQLWTILCGTGPFDKVDQSLYSTFLKGLGAEHLISQMQNGTLVLGDVGERIAGHYTFYAAFKTPEEYRLEHNGHVLGSVPLNNPLVVGSSIIFAGKKWTILDVDTNNKRVSLQEGYTGRPPKFYGGIQTIHDIVRQEMFRVYHKRDCPIYLDATAKTLFDDGIAVFHDLRLEENPIVQFGQTTYVFPWLGDKETNTLSMLLRQQGISANADAGIIEINKVSAHDLEEAMRVILQQPRPTAQELAEQVADAAIEKHDHFLTPELQKLNYGATHFDIDTAWRWLTDGYKNSSRSQGR